MKYSFVIIASCFLASCSESVGPASNLDGCYFGAGSNYITKIKDGIVYNNADVAISSIKSVNNKRDNSIVELNNGVKFIDDDTKALKLYPGEEYYLLAFSRFGKVHFIVGSATANEIIQRSCQK